MNITEYIERKTKSFFDEQKSDVPPSRHLLNDLKRWKIDFRDFTEDIFKKWLASRSAVAVNQLLDDGLSAEDEQVIVKKLENELSNYFDFCLNSFFASLLTPFRYLWIGIFVWSVLLGALAYSCFPTSVERLSIVNFWIAGVSLFGAKTLTLIQKKNLVKRSERFIENFFIEAEKKWVEDQNKLRQQQGV